MKGDDITNMSPWFELSFGFHSMLSVGDGGNEFGMGKFACSLLPRQVSKSSYFNNKTVLGASFGIKLWVLFYIERDEQLKSKGSFA